MAECSPSSASALHKQWAKLENEHHELATAIDAAQAKKADVALMRKRQDSLLLEISSLVAEIRNAPATTIEDCLALLDHELDLACENGLLRASGLSHHYSVIARSGAGRYRGSNLTPYGGGYRFRANSNS